MRVIEQSLATLSKNLETAEGLVAKARNASYRLTCPDIQVESSKSKNKINKQNEANADLTRAKVLWKAEALSGFEKLQRADEARVALVKDALVRLITNEVDAAQNVSRSAEQIMTTLLDISPQEEPVHFLGCKSIDNVSDTTSRPTGNSLSRKKSVSGYSEDVGSVRSGAGSMALGRSKKF